VGRAGSKAVTLKDGRILILGGQDAGGIDNAVDIYDSVTSATAYGTPGPTGPYTAVTGAIGDYMANANCAYTSGPTHLHDLATPVPHGHPAERRQSADRRRVG
jgi:hypothetical protein